jgi:maltose 6'-phosphate phosphatase
MQPPSSFRAGLAGLITLLSLLPVTTGVAWGQNAVCPDVAERGYLDLLTINLLFSEVETRDARLAALAEFIAPDDGAGAAPLADVILLQEVVGGVLAETASSAQDLQRLLAGRGVTFELRTAAYFSLPGQLTVGNATLSRCDIRTRLVEGLPPAPEFEIGGEAVELPRNVLMTRIDVPGFGRIEVYNTHLCAGCTAEQRAEQLEALLEFVDGVEGLLPGADPVVLGGDFNIDIFREDEEAGRPLYASIIAAGFTDAYAEGASAADLEELCEDPDNPDEHCTIGVSALSTDSNARRIDYIFTENFGPVPSAEVVFNPLIEPGEPTVSDHSGVLVRVALPGAEPLM